MAKQMHVLTFFNVANGNTVSLQKINGSYIAKQKMKALKN